jgi:DNA-directed RNA polymerase specialized sigma24 family protein
MPTESFDGCYLRLWPVAVRLGHLISGSREVGEDLAQDVFVALRDRWESIENPDGYVRRAVVNRAKTAARRRARERTGAVPELPVLPSEMYDVWSALLRLPVHHRAAIVLRYYEELADDDIAELLDCRPATVRTWLLRGRTKLKELLA